MPRKRIKPVSTLDTPQLYVEQIMDEPEVYRLNGGSVAVFSARSPDKEDPNEDAAALLPLSDDAAILVVADGAGGMANGAQASRLAVHAVTQEARAADMNITAVRDVILNGIENASESINNLGIGAGTTIAAVEIQGATVRPYHVGDSMVLGVGQRGKLKMQTVSHSPVGYAVEAGFLDADEAMHHEERHLVSNMVGSPDMRIEIGAAVSLAQRDTLLLATDGLFDNLHVEEITEYIRIGTLKQAADRLVTACRERMRTVDSGLPSKPDDLTFILYRRPG